MNDNRFIDQNSERILDGIDKRVSHLFDGLLGVQVLTHFSERFFKHDVLELEVIEPLLHNFSAVFRKLDQSSRSALVTRRVHFEVVNLSSVRINPSVAKSSDGFVLSTLEHEYNARNDVHGLQQVHLRFCVRESFHDPSVDFAITLLQSLLNQPIYNCIRNLFSIIDACGYDFACSWVFKYFFL